MRIPTSDTKENRRRAVAWALSLTANTPLAPQRYERQLLARYERGELTLNQVAALLDASSYQVLYHSQATPQPSEAQLQTMLTESRAYNMRYQITGLLLYGDGHFLQVLEGAEANVRPLYARIQRDRRHAQVTTLSAGPGLRFMEWHMAFRQVPAPVLNQVLAAVQAPEPLPLPAMDDPYVAALVQAFGPADGAGQQNQ